MIENVAGDDGRHAGQASRVRDRLKLGGVVRTKAPRQRTIGAVAKDIAQPRQMRAQFRGGVLRHEDRDQSPTPLRYIFEGELALAFACALLTGRKQPAEARIS